MAKGTKIKHLMSLAEGMPDEAMKGLARIANHPDFKYLVLASNIARNNIVLDAFNLPIPKDNLMMAAVDKQYYKGGHFYLHKFIEVVRRSPEILEQREEQEEARSK